MSRAEEVLEYSGDRRLVYLAREIDDVESVLSAGIDRLIKAQEHGQKLLTGVLIAIIASLVVFPLTVLLQIGR